MFNLFTFQTPPRFATAFRAFYTKANLKQVKILSMTVLVIALVCRAAGLIFHRDVVNMTGYYEHSIANWIQLSGAIVFYAISTFVSKNRFDNPKICHAVILSFVVFILLITLGVSYTVSLHNTKNTLTMFLIGIVSVSLFFALEYREIIVISTIITLIFAFSMVFPQSSLQNKFMNLLAAVILGFVLIIFSRYSYYYKSQHFVRLKQLEEKNQEIERLNTQKGEILAFVAHDLRRPLNNIEALSSLLLLEEEADEKAVMIGDATKQAKTIINDLLEAVRSEKPLETERINLNTFLAKNIEKWKTDGQKRITFIAPKESITANINPSKLERVVDNLISNAIKFSPANQLVDVSLVGSQSHVSITVEDHGIGIPASLQPYLFDQFSTAGRKGLSGENSVGLGLHISRKIVEQHHGRLTCKSTENEGTTFTIDLPLA